MKDFVSDTFIFLRVPQNHVVVMNPFLKREERTFALKPSVNKV